MLTACLPLLKFSARTLNPSMWLMMEMKKTAGNKQSPKATALPDFLI